MKGETFFSTTLPIGGMDRVVPAFVKRNVLDNMRFKKLPEKQWPQPVIGNEGVPPEFLTAGKYPFEPGTDVPEGMEIIREGPTGGGARLDRAMRRPQLTNLIMVGRPTAAEEGERYANPENIPLDPSVISIELMGTRQVRGRDFMGTAFRQLPGPSMRAGSRNPIARLSGMGADATTTTTAPTILQQAALMPIEMTITTLRNKEATLMAYAPAAFQQTAAAYAKLRSDLFGYYDQMKASPALIASLGGPFTAAAATYKMILDTAMQRMNEAAKAQAQAQAQAQQSLPARVSTAASTAVSTAASVLSKPMVLIPLILGAGALGYLAMRRRPAPIAR